MLKELCRRCLHKALCIENGKCLKAEYDGEFDNVYDEGCDLPDFGEMYDDDLFVIKPPDEPDDDFFEPD